MRDKSLAELEGMILDDFKETEKIERADFYTSFFCCRKKYKSQMAHSASRVDKELDLVKFIKR